MNRHLIVLTALVGREQRTAVLLGQVGYGLNKRDASYLKFREYSTVLCLGIENSDRGPVAAQAHYKN
jgi:hypothetical protein